MAYRVVHGTFIPQSGILDLASVNFTFAQSFKKTVFLAIWLLSAGSGVGSVPASRRLYHPALPDWGNPTLIIIHPILSQQLLIQLLPIRRNSPPGIA
jgi:hypothetical protein